MKRTIQYIIQPAEDNKTILDFLKSKGYSHGILTHLKKTSHSILLNGTWEYVRTRIHTGDTLCIVIDEPSGSDDIVPTEFPLSIFYEDEDILVVNKPSGMPIHPSHGHYDNTLANAVCGYFSKQGIPYTFRCVNRLDRDTTGLVILAKHMLSAAILNQAIKKREIHREYLALADGLVPEEGTINAPIARKDGSTIERIVDFENGEHAVTHYKRLSYENGLSLLSLHLETGRTHQIRVHMKYLGHPLIGDFLYHPDYQDAQKKSSLANSFARQALHSYRLQFHHPITGIPMDLIAPLPADMAALVSQDIPVHTESDQQAASLV